MNHHHPPSFLRRNRRLAIATAAVAAVILLAAEYRSALRPPLRLMVWANAAEKEALESRLYVFSLANHGLRVQMTAFGDAQECRNRFLFQSRRGDPPDVCLVSACDLALWVEGGHVRNLKDLRFDPQPFLPQALAAFSRGNDLYAVPSGWSVPTLYYNRALFERQGVPPPKPSWDWGDLLAAAQALTVTDPENGQALQYGLELSPAAAAWIPWIWQNRGEVFDEEGNPCLTDPRFVQSNLRTVEFYAELVRKQGVAPSPARPGTMGGDASLFLQQKAAMVLAHRSLASALRERPALDWDIAPLPGMAQSATWLDVAGYAVSPQTHQMPAAWELVRFLTGETSQQTMILPGRWAPSRRNLLTGRVFMDFPGPRAVNNRALVDSLGSARLPPPSLDWEAASAILTDEMTLLMSGNTPSARQSLERMQARLDELNLVRQRKKR